MGDAEIFKTIEARSCFFFLDLWLEGTQVQPLICACVAEQQMRKTKDKNKTIGSDNSGRAARTMHVHDFTRDFEKRITYGKATDKFVRDRHRQILLGNF